MKKIFDYLETMPLAHGYAWAAGLAAIAIMVSEMLHCGGR